MSGGSERIGPRFQTLRSNKMSSFNIETESDAVKIGTPKTLFPTGIRHSIPADGYDVTRDGKFLVVNSITESTAPVVLVTHTDLPT